ncbi:hypothetical protein WG628_04835 [Stenotrophomonas maltophilia]
MQNSKDQQWTRWTTAGRTGVAAALLLPVMATTAGAQNTTGNFVWEEFPDRIAKAEKVSALGPDLFGDKVGLANGELGFEITDVDLPGNNALEVKLTRTYDVVSRKVYFPEAMLADWQIKVPNINGSYAPDWGAGTDAGSPGRCSSSWLPPEATHFSTRDFWRGLSVEIPGGGGELLRTAAGVSQPQDGSTYPWTTSGQIFFSCLPTIQNAGGEGFLAITPDGTRYWFDWLAQTFEPTLKKYQYFYDDGSLPKPQPWRFLQRRKNMLLATRVQDRFGNTVQYTYANAWNEAPRLTAITASDGRQITLSYQGNNVSSVSDGARQWQYQYNSTPSRRGLSAVLLPDGSQWSISFEDFTRAALRYAEVMSPEPGEMFRNCIENEIPIAYPAEFITGRMVHPSGASGQFTVTSLEHGRSHVPLNCRGIDYIPGFGNNPNDDINTYAISGFQFHVDREGHQRPGAPCAALDVRLHPEHQHLPIPGATGWKSGVPIWECHRLCRAAVYQRGLRAIQYHERERTRRRMDPLSTWQYLPLQRRQAALGGGGYRPVRYQTCDNLPVRPAFHWPELSGAIWNQRAVLWGGLGWRIPSPTAGNAHRTAGRDLLDGSQ